MKETNDIAARVDRMEKRIDALASLVEAASSRKPTPSENPGESGFVTIPVEDPDDAKTICCFYGKVSQVNRMKNVARVHGMSFSRFMRFAFAVAEAHDFRMPQ